MSLRRALFTLILVYLALLGLARSVGESYYSIWLPLLRVELKCLLPVDSLLNVGVTTRDGELVYAARIAVQNGPSATADHNVTSTVVIVSTLTGNALQPPIIMLSLILASVNVNVRKRCLAFLVALPVIAVLFSIDVPFLLAGAVDELLRTGADVHQGGVSNLTRYVDVLDHGGRFALAMIAAAVIVELVGRWGEGGSD